MTNIDAFNIAAAVLLGKLHAEFPRPVMLNIDALRDESALAADAWWERGSDNLLAATLRWLHAEGYVRYASEGAGGRRFAEVVLSARGLSALNRLPESLVAKATVGDRLKDLAYAASAEAVTALVRIALSS